MDTSRVGPGVWLGALGGLVLLIALFFLDWYSLEPKIAPLEISSSFFAQVDPNEIQIPDVQLEADIGAWDGEGFLGVIANLVMIAAAVWAIVAVGIRSGAAELDTGMDPGRLTFILGIAATVMVLLRMIFTPGDGDFVDTSLKFGIFVALAGALLIAIGGAMSRETAPAPPRAPAGEPPPPPPPPASEPPPPAPPSRGP
jgi:hypothetical protein